MRVEASHSPVHAPHYPGLQPSIFAGAFVFGIVMASLGALLPALFGAIGFQKADAGSLFLLMNFGMLVSSLLFGPVCDRFGFRALLLISTVMVGGAFAGLAAARSYGMLAGSLAILGLGGGALNGGANALINDISPDRRASALNLLGIFFGVGALVTPFMTGALLQHAGLRAMLLTFLVLTLAPVALFAVARFPAPKHERGLPVSALLRLARNPLLLLFGLLLFCESGNEFTVGGWASTYLGERLGFDPRNAAFVLGGYWAAVMAGRGIVSRIARRVPPAALVGGSAFVALIGSAGLVFARSAPLAAAAVACTGLGFAAIFPTTLAQAGAAFPEYSGSAFSVIFVMALSGGMTAPWLFGRVTQNHEVGLGFWITVASCAAIIAVQIAVSRWTTSKIAGSD